MAYPAGVVTRPLTLGVGTRFEDGTPLGITATVKASRSLVWSADGTPLLASGTKLTAPDGDTVTFTLPVTDQGGYLTNTGEAVILGDGDHTHTYTIEGQFTKGGLTLVPFKIGPFVVPTGDGSPLDADKLIPVTGGDGSSVSVPDQWSDAISTLQAQIAALGGGGDVAAITTGTSDPGSSTPGSIYFQIGV